MRGAGSRSVCLCGRTAAGGSVFCLSSSHSSPARATETDDVNGSRYRAVVCVRRVREGRLPLIEERVSMFYDNVT